MLACQIHARSWLTWVMTSGWRGWWLCIIASVADDWLMTWRVNPVQLQTIGRRRRVESMVRVGVRGQCCRRRVLARAGMQDVGSSSGVHQWICLFFLYTMVMSKTRLENFEFWVWIKHPLFQEQALIPVVGSFTQSNTYQFTWFGNLPTPRSYWLVLITQRNNTNKGGGENSSQLNSTHSSSLCCSHFSSVLSMFFTLTHAALHWAYMYTR